MALGQAFVEVHADLKPFRRNLQQDLKKITDDFEKQMKQALGVRMKDVAKQTGRDMGIQVGDGVSDGLKNKLGHKEASPFVAIAGALAGALDDGISALPMEVKAAMVAGLLAASPLVAGALAAAISAGVAVAFVGVGIALASQFQSVQNAWPNFVSGLRIPLVKAAGSFEDALLRTFALIQIRVERLGPTLERIFSISATFLEPLVNGLFNAIESFLSEMDDVLGKSGGFVDELARGLNTLAMAAAQALAILASTGQDGQKALRDLIMLVAGLVVGIAGLIAALTTLYGRLRDAFSLFARFPIIAQILFPIPAALGHIALATDEVSRSNQAWVHTNTDLLDSQGRVITRTKEEEDRVKDLAKAIADAADATLNAITANVSYEDSIDDLADALKENGKNINIDTEAGRANVTALATSIEKLRTQLTERVKTGELTTAQAVAQYDREIQRIEELANKAGITDEAFRQLFGTSIELSRLAIDPDSTGLDAATASAEELLARLKEIIALAKVIGGGAAAGAIAGARRGLADGGFAFLPETIDIAEDGPEVVIPLTKPARAAQLMRQAGLDNLGSGGSTEVLVFIGDEQLEQKMVRVVQGNNSAQQLAMTHGSRRF
jgi:hypothetical protein